MLTLLFFILTFAALGAMVWSGYQLLQPQENPLDDRLGELMATRRQAENRGSKRKLGGGFLNSRLAARILRSGGRSGRRSARAGASTRGGASAPRRSVSPGPVGALCHADPSGRSASRRTSEPPQDTQPASASAVACPIAAICTSASAATCAKWVTTSTWCLEPRSANA